MNAQIARLQKQIDSIVNKEDILIKNIKVWEWNKEYALFEYEGTEYIIHYKPEEILFEIVTEGKSYVSYYQEHYGYPDMGMETVEERYPDWDEDVNEDVIQEFIFQNPKYWEKTCS